MEFEGKHELSVFGRAITICHPNAYTTKISKTPILKISEEAAELFKRIDVVFLIKENQFGAMFQQAINTKDYGVSADEFISEFTRINAKYCLK